jgi:hypothetical protein
MKKSATCSRRWANALGVGRLECHLVEKTASLTAMPPHPDLLPRGGEGAEQSEDFSTKQLEGLH